MKRTKQKPNLKSNKPFPAHKWYFYIFLGFVVSLVLVESILRLHAAWILRSEVRNHALPAVTVMFPKKSTGTEELVLPGNIEAWHQATIYARINGYVKRWLTPIGTFVHKDDILAEIETPEVDAQLRQAIAEVKTAQASYDLAKITAARWVFLRKTDSVSKQEADEKVSDAKAKEAVLASAKANRDHLYELTIFKIVRAPFDGVITDRNIDIGTLVNSGNNPMQPLFSIVQSDKLRVYVKVPQIESARIVDGVCCSQTGFQDKAQIDTSSLELTADNPVCCPDGAELRSLNSVPDRIKQLGAKERAPGVYKVIHENASDAGNNAENQNAKCIQANVYFIEHPDEVFHATLYDMSKNLDPSTRTLLTEFLLNNPDRKLFAGGYASVHILLPATGYLRLPVNALIFRSSGMQVATVQNGKVVLKNIVIRRDFGTEVEIASGLTENDYVILNPSDSLGNGQEVTMMKPILK